MPRPAPVTTATRPSNRCSLTQSGGDWCEAEDAAEGAAEHGGALVGGHTGELRLDQLLAATERAFGVGVVGSPHDGRQASDVAGGDGDGVVLERHVELALHVLARLERVRPL